MADQAQAAVQGSSLARTNYTVRTVSYVDSLSLGAWVAMLGFPTWIAYAALNGMEADRDSGPQPLPRPARSA